VAARPFQISVYDKDLNFRGRVPRLLEVTANPRHMAIQTASFKIDEDNPRRTDLVAEGARCVVRLAGRHLMSTTVDTSSAEGPMRKATRTFTLSDDLAIFYDTLGWQVPGASLAGQAAAEYYDVTGPAETVVKTLVAANATTRLGRPVTVAPDLGRGDTITVSTRMHTLADRLIVAADLAGIGITVRQDGDGFVVDCYEPRTFAHTLRERTGALTSWKHSTAAPTVTRVVVGAGGEGIARVFLGPYIDSAREAAWGVVREVFVDARDLKVDDPELAAKAATRAAEALAAGAPKSGLALTLADTPAFGFPNAVNVGDRVPVDIGRGTVVTDVLRSAQITWRAGANGGLNVEPQVGEISDDPDTALADALRATADRVQRIAVER
jgi:hypothetical protein